MGTNETGTITLRLMAQDLASGNVGKFIGNIDRLAKQGGLMGSVMQGVGLSFGQMLNPMMLVANGIGAVTSFMADGVGLASDYAEQQSKVQAVFGDLSDEIESFAKDSATNLRMSEREALTFLGTIGNLFDALGLGERDVVNMSKGLSQLAADLASFNNANIQEVMTALQSGLVGETEPMRRFGANLSAARVQAYALASGMAASAGAITDAIKVQARYELILQDTVNAQGDAAKTADGYAGSMATIKAEFENVQTELGTALLPTLKEFTTWLKDLMGLLGKNDQAAKEWSITMAEAAGATETGGDAIVSLRDGIQSLNDVLQPQVDEAADFAKSMHTMADAAGVSDRAIMDMFLRLKDNAQMGSDGAKAAIEEYLRTLYLAETHTLIAETVITGAWTGTAKGVEEAAGDAETAIHGVYLATKRTATGALETMDQAKDPWRTAWKQMAAWAKDPFKPHAFENWLERRAKKAVENARKAAEDGRPGVARRWRAIANAMKSPVTQALVNLGMEVDEAIQKIMEVQAMAKRIDPLAIVVTGAGGGGAPQTYTRPRTGDTAGHNAEGTSNWRGGWSWVGERGPELVNLPTGTRVLSNPESERVAAAGASPTVVVNLAWHSPAVPSEAEGQRLAAAIAPHIARHMARAGA